MQKETREQIIPIRFSKDELTNIDRLLQRSGARSRSEFIREAVRYYLNTVAQMQVVRIRKVSMDQAKKEILDFIKDRKEADTFDIANGLRLDMDITVKALRELWEEGMVK